ncbi:MAG: efflux RND transporter periplasmic adaptor subunit, partial [Planctomycetota bacterium]
SQAEIDNAEAQRRRAERAAATGAMTPEELDVRRTAVLTAEAAKEAALALIESSKAQIAAAVAQVEQAKLDLGYTSVTSPISGRAGRRYVDIGNLVGSGEPTLLTNVIKYDPIYAYFTISEKQYQEFTREMLERDPQALVDGSNKEEQQRVIYLGWGDEEGFPHKGKFDFAELALDETTGTYEIRAIFDNPQRAIPAGAFVRIQVPRAEVEALVVPDEAVGRDQTGAYVLVVDSADAVEKRAVTLGGKYDGLRAISGNISEEDRIVVSGLQRARPGAKVTPRTQASSDASPTAPSPEASDGDEK